MRVQPGRRLTVALSVLLLAAASVSGAVLASPGASASDNGLSIRPALGWSSWSFVRRDPTEANIKAQAAAMKSSGLAAHGYVYVNLDDFYMKCDAGGPVVDGYGRWTVDTARFPHGMKALADYIHGLGLKFGVYVTPGIPQNAVTQNTPIAGTPYHARDIAIPAKTEKNYNCGHMYYIDHSKPGAQQYVNSFADLFASWTADYLKIDGVGADDIDDVRAWAAALRQTGRPINYALSNNLPIANGATWRQLANSWRTGDDVECYCSGRPEGVGYPLTDWKHVNLRFSAVAAWQPYAGPGNWPDYDSIEIGNGDRAGINADQRRSQLTLWSMAAAPLLLGTDLTDLDATDKAMLTNDRVLGVDRDGVAAKRIVNTGGGQVFSKKEKSGAYVVALFNTRTSGNVTVSASWPQVGFKGAAKVTDLWSGRSGGTVGTGYTATLRPGETRLIRAVPVSGAGGGAVSYEAEAPGNTVAGAAVVAPCDACSGGREIGYIGNGAGNYVTVNGVRAKISGTEALTISYLLDGSRSFFVSVNGGAEQEVPLTGTGFTEVSTAIVPVMLHAGSNTITFRNDAAYGPDLDKVTVG